jgi:uncharacterized membrane protein
MTRVYFVFSVATIVAVCFLSAVAYPNLPPQVPIHWNLQGQADGYGSPTVAAFLMPFAMVVLLLVLSALPWLSPKQFETDAFCGVYWFIVFIFMAYMGYVHGLILWATFGHSIDVVRSIIGGMLLMFGLMGNVLGKVRRNFWVGVRTPWTLANERVWNDTHRLAGRLFVAAALICLPLLFLPVPVASLFFIVMTLIVGAALVPAVYSAIHYKWLQAQNQL